jgi:hypothetical protein
LCASHRAIRCFRCPRPAATVTESGRQGRPHEAGFGPLGGGASNTGSTRGPGCFGLWRKPVVARITELGKQAKCVDVDFVEHRHSLCRLLHLAIVHQLVQRLGQGLQQVGMHIDGFPVRADQERERSGCQQPTSGGKLVRRSGSTRPSVCTYDL